MNDLDIKTLINSAVDAELGGHRVAPPFDRAAIADRPGPGRTVRLWSAPLLAASVAVLLTVGAMLAITLNRGQRSNHGSKPANPSPSPSLSWFTDPDQDKATRAYQEAVATAAEPDHAGGVDVEPLSAQDAARFRDTGLMGGDVSSITSPTPGKKYSFTLRYLAGPSENPPAVLTTEVRDVDWSACPVPFLARPGHAYVMHCDAVLLAGATGKATIELRSPTGTTSGSINLTGPAGYPASPSASISPEPDELSRVYAQALATAPEASAVAGVSARPTTAEERQRTGETVGLLDGIPPVPGKSYTRTLLFIPRSGAPAISVLAIKLEDVASGRCPRPFRIRPGQAYLIHCQVTLRAGASGVAYYTVTEPHGVTTSGMGLN